MPLVMNLSLSLLTTLALGAGFIPCVQAATTLPFTITLRSVPEGDSSLQIGQEFHGSVTYSATVPSTGIATLDPSTDSTITLTFEFEGNTYTALDAIEYPSFPRLYFTDGVIRGMFFDTANRHSSATEDGFISIESSNHLTYSYDGAWEFDAIVSWAPAVTAPEPSTLLFSFSSLLVAFRRQRAS